MEVLSKLVTARKLSTLNIIILMLLWRTLACTFASSRKNIGIICLSRLKLQIFTFFQIQSNACCYAEFPCEGVLIS